MPENFLQKPGGLGPTPALRPLGGAVPETYRSPNSAIPGFAGMHDTSRTLAQYQTDIGAYSRAPVGPTNYQLSNIMPSAEPVGVAGYNNKDPLPTPGKAADLSKQQYLLSETNNLNPAVAQNLQMVTALPKQNFFNPQDPSYYAPVNYNMPDNLYMQAPPMTEKRGE